MLDLNNAFDISAAVKVLCGKFLQINSVYIFGSRRFGTRSTRSDIDLLLFCDEYIAKNELRNFVIHYQTALDLFIADNGRAESIANESYIVFGDNRTLIERLDAVEIYTRGSGESDFLKKNKIQLIDRRVDFKMTVLPGDGSLEAYQRNALLKFFAAAGENGLPSKPYIGSTTSEAAEFLIEVLRSIPAANAQVTGYGQAKDGWTIIPKDEYDFQNLFWITVKPWLPGLMREEIAIEYDGKEKRSDFSLFNSQLIMEFKHIKDAGDVRETTKTLRGLSHFYQRHHNVRLLIFAIFVNHDVIMDDRLIEHDYSFEENGKPIKTVVIRNNCARLPLKRKAI